MTVPSGFFFLNLFCIYLFIIQSLFYLFVRANPFTPCFTLQYNAGSVVANDADPKRAYMLVHQVYIFLNAH